MSSVKEGTSTNGLLRSPEKLNGEFFVDERGKMRVLAKLPFFAKRMFWIHDVPQWSSRGNHAHRECDQVIGCFGGTCKLTLRHGADEQSHQLSRDCAVFVPAGWFIRLETFSAGATAWVLASHEYDENEVIDGSEVQ